MSAQLRYDYLTTRGCAGGIVDLAPYKIDSFINEEASGVMKFGYGVVKGTRPGTDVKLPTSASTIANFEGVTVNGRTTEYDLEGGINIRTKKNIGVMKFGRVYVQVDSTVTTITDGDQAYLVISGAELGKFTNVAGSNMKLKARFKGNLDPNLKIAAIDLFDQYQEA